MSLREDFHGLPVVHEMDGSRVRTVLTDPDVQKILLEQVERVAPEVRVTSLRVEPDFRPDAPGEWTVIQLMSGDQPVNGAIVRQCQSCHAVYCPGSGHPVDGCELGAASDVVEE